MTRAAAQAARRREFARAAPSAPDWPTLLGAWEQLLGELDVARYEVAFVQGRARAVVASSYAFDPSIVGEVGRTRFRFPTALGADLEILLAGAESNVSDTARLGLHGMATAFAARLLQLREFAQFDVADETQTADFPRGNRTRISFTSR